MVWTFPVHKSDNFQRKGDRKSESIYHITVEIPGELSRKNIFSRVK